MSFAWDYFYLRDKKIVNKDGDQVFNPSPDFNSIEEAENWLIANDERGNVIGNFYEYVTDTDQTTKPTNQTN